MHSCGAGRSRERLTECGKVQSAGCGAEAKENCSLRLLQRLTNLNPLHLVCASYKVQSAFSAI